jgi:hypothetical protein
MADVCIKKEVNMDTDKILEVDGKPAFAYHGGKLWVAVNRIWKHLGTIERAMVLTCDQLQCHKKDGGTYIPYDSMIEMVPQADHAALLARKEELIRKATNN